MTDESNEEHKELPPLPKQLSPSRASDYKLCPQKYYFGSIAKVPTKPSLATTKGTLAHECLEKLFEHPREERTPETALSYLAAAWDGLCGFTEPAEEGSRYAQGQQAYRELAPQGSDTEKQLLADAKQMVENYFEIENPKKFDPKGTEVRMFAKVSNAPLLGLIDRLDLIKSPDGDRWFISDYKSGRVPAENDRWMEDKFWAMKVYAVLLQEIEGVVAHELRLIYLAQANKKAVRRMKINQQMINQTRKEMIDIWGDILKDYENRHFEARKNRLCDWCDFKSICPAWNAGADGLHPDVKNFS